MLIINDSITLFLLAEHCKMVQMIISRDQNPSLNLDFNHNIIEQFLEWLKTEKLNCQSIDELKELCQLADYLDCNVYDFHEDLITLMKKLSYRRFRHVMFYHNKITDFNNNTIHRPLYQMYHYKYDYLDPHIRYPEDYSQSNDWLSFIQILNIPENILRHLNNIYDNYFTKFKEYDELKYAIYTETAYLDSDDDIKWAKANKYLIKRSLKLEKELIIYWDQYGEK